MWRIVKVDVSPGYRPQVEFADGVTGVVDLSEKLWGPSKCKGSVRLARREVEPARRPA